MVAKRPRLAGVRIGWEKISPDAFENLVAPLLRAIGHQNVEIRVTESRLLVRPAAEQEGYPGSGSGVRPMAGASQAFLGWRVLPFLIILASACGSHENRIERAVRLAALAQPRPVEGRLSVAARFARWKDSPAAQSGVPSPFPDDNDKRVLRGSGPQLASREAAELHLAGLLLLYHGKVARAVSVLEAAAEQKPSAAILSDLAAAYLALSEDDRPWLRADAITAAARAAETGPSERYATFNLALALERMCLVHESRLAWERFLTLESDQEWRQEASQHLARLRQPAAIDRWEDEKDRAVTAAGAGDRAALASLARQFPHQMRDLLERDLLSAWADAAGTPAERPRLAAAKLVAETFATKRERLYVDVIAFIENRSRAAMTLTDGYRTYAQALAMRGDCSKAESAFGSALDRLTATGNPLAWAARFEQLECLYRRDPAGAAPQLAKLASDLESLPYPTLRARTAALRGLCAMAGGRHTEAVGHYDRALKLLTELGDPDVTRLLGMIDEAYRFLGDRETAWRYRMKALHSAVAAGNGPMQHAVLTGLARELVGAGRREAARAVLDEMLANALASTEPAAPAFVAESLLRRIQLDNLGGSEDQAAADLTACAHAIELCSQPADRERLATELIVASAEHELAGRPSDALALIMNAISRIEATSDGLLQPRAFLCLARASISLGDPAAAERAFQHAIQIYETRRKGTGGDRLRITFFSTAQESLDAMIRFQAFDRRDARAAFTYSEQAHARALRDHLPEKTGTAPLPLEAQLARIPANVCVVAYAELPESLLVWRLYQGSLTMHVLPTSRGEVVQTVRALRAALTNAGQRAVAKAAAVRAFKVLLHPAIEGLPAGTDLVFVPDRELYLVPFAALFDPAHEHYLVQDHACLVAPSLDFYLESELRRAATPQPHRVLVVGDPAFDRAQFPDLPRLPHAREEALAVAALYKNPLLLLGPDATRQRILNGLTGRMVLHLAAHVVVDPRDPLESVIATADPVSAPLRASDLDAQRLKGVDLVFLGACDTAPGFADGDREGVAGLARALLAAGVPSVIATLWAVDDHAAAQLGVAFHAGLSLGDSPGQSLRRAQLAALADSSSPAPFAWASFQLYRGH